MKKKINLKLISFDNTSVLETMAIIKEVNNQKIITFKDQEDIINTIIIHHNNINIKRGKTTEIILNETTYTKGVIKTPYGIIYPVIITTKVLITSNKIEAIYYVEEYTKEQKKQLILTII
jgi:hypothetical protein